LLKAALECFLADEYHKVSTRMIAEQADAKVSMIRYYFGNKQCMYEEMISEIGDSGSGENAYRVAESV
jgi:AcrR family transcriptional regulator